MLLGFALAVSPLLLGCGFSAQLAGIALGLVIAIGLYQRLHRSLLSRGLERVLAQPKDPS